MRVQNRKGNRWSICFYQSRTKLRWQIDRVRWLTKGGGWVLPRSMQKLEIFLIAGWMHFQSSNTCGHKTPNQCSWWAAKGAYTEVWSSLWRVVSICHNSIMSQPSKKHRLLKLLTEFVYALEDVFVIDKLYMYGFVENVSYISIAKKKHTVQG